MRLLLGLILLSCVNFARCFLQICAFGGRTHSRMLLNLGKIDEGGDKGKIKLPIVQFIDEKQELVGEFVCGNDLSGSIDKMRATLTSLSKTGPGGGSGCSVDNVYSDEQLTDILLRGESFIILKLYRDGCKKCSALEPVFVEMAGKSTNPRFRWLQAEVTNIPAHTAALKLRLKGSAPPS